MYEFIVITLLVFRPVNIICKFVTIGRSDRELLSEIPRGGGASAQPVYLYTATCAGEG